MAFRSRLSAGLALLSLSVVQDWADCRRNGLNEQYPGFGSVRFGSLAASQHHISRMAAFGGNAVIQITEI